MKFNDKMKRIFTNYPALVGRLADRLHVTTRAVQFYTRSGRPNLGSLVTVAATLQVPLEWLCDDTADWPPPANVPASAIREDQRLLLDVLDRLEISAADVIVAMVAAQSVAQPKVFQLNAKPQPGAYAAQADDDDDEEDDNL